MHAFVDNQTRTWKIRIDVNAIRLLRTQLGIDLNQVLHDKSMIRDIANDVVQLVDMLYLLVKEQCDAQQVTAESFGAALVGEAIEEASEAFIKALIDFFPQSRRRVLQAALEAAKEGQTLVMEKIDQAIEKGLMKRQLQKDLASIDEKIDEALNS